MKHIGVRDLKSQLNSVVRTVREKQIEYTVTLHGQPVAILRPFTAQDMAQSRKAMIEQELAMIDGLVRENEENWPSGESLLETLEQVREESACR